MDKITEENIQEKINLFQQMQQQAQALTQQTSQIEMSINEIETLLDFKYLDIEFAIDGEEQIYIFQVRPITKINKQVSNNSDDVKITLN